jgi:exodeoxyribonuclease V beta subunit
MTRPVFHLHTDHLPDGMCLLEASAGTGKTWTLTHLVLRALLGDGVRPPVPPAAILVVTFTRAAVDELRTRLDALVRRARDVAAQNATADPDLRRILDAAPHPELLPERLALMADTVQQMTVATLHGWCQSVLVTSGETAPGTEMELDVRPLVADVVLDAWRIQAADDPVLAAVLLRRSPDADIRLVQDYRLQRGTRTIPDAADAPLSTALEQLRALVPGPDPGGRCADALAASDEAVTAAADDVVAAWLAWLLPWVSAEVERRLTVAGRQTPDRIVASLADAVSDAGPDAGASPQRAALRRRYALTLVDEFQDTDPDQWRILRAACVGAPGQRLVLIGDPKQAIYGFRGGDLPTYLAAAQAATAAWRLGVNHRTDATLLAAIQALFAGEDPFATATDGAPGLAADASTAAGRCPLEGDPGPPLRWWLPDRDIPSKDQAAADIAQAIVGEIRRCDAAGISWRGRPLAHSDIAVLVRTRAQADIVRTALVAAGIPAVLQDAGDLLAAPAVVELRQLLIAVAAPGDAEARRTALATRLAGGTAADLTDADGHADDALAAHVLRLHRLWRRRGLAACIDALLRLPMPPLGVPPLVRAAGWPDAERWLTDLRHVADHLAATAPEMAPDAEAIGRLLVGAGEERRPDERRLHLDQDGAAVRVLTMHAAKGLEWPVVFCPFLWSSTDVRDGAPVVIAGVRTMHVHPGASDHRETAARQGLAEELRLAYVALTRAQARLYIAWGAFGKAAKSSAGSALGWLLGPRPSTGDPAAVWTALPGWKPNERTALLTAGLARLPAEARGVWAPATVASLPSHAGPAAPPADPVAVLPLRPGATGTWTETSFTAVARGGLSAETDDDDAPTPQAEDDLARLARGPAAGIVLHRVLARQDWQADPDPVRIAADLAGWDQPDRHQGAAAGVVVADLIAQLRRTDLGGWTLPAAVGQRREWRFALPWSGVAPEAVAKLAADSGLDAATVAAIATPGATPGFLVGSIDLLALAGDTWRIIDWKSTWLAPAAAGYTPAVCAAAMTAGMYRLQAALYAVAVRRWLDRRGDARPITAACVFLRGPAVVDATPPPALIAGLLAQCPAGAVAP